MKAGHACLVDLFETCAGVTLDIGSIIVLQTSGRPGNWKSFFPSEAQAVATVDRHIDQATILRFTGKSFRKPKNILG